jgi:hypothetical protein
MAPCGSGPYHQPAPHTGKGHAAHSHAFGLDCDDTGGEHYRHFAPFHWQSYTAEPTSVIATTIIVMIRRESA